MCYYFWCVCYIYTDTLDYAWTYAATSFAFKKSERVVHWPSPASGWKKREKRVPQEKWNKNCVKCSEKEKIHYCLFLAPSQHSLLFTLIRRNYILLSCLFTFKRSLCISIDVEEWMRDILRKITFPVFDLSLFIKTSSSSHPSCTHL